MEHSMRLVEQHCSKYLAMFGECVHQFPHTWQMDCEQERRKLARCAETNPEILHIKSVCAAQFSVYEKCMNENKSNSDKCTESFLEFTACAQDALGTFKPKTGPVSTVQVNESVQQEAEQKSQEKTMTETTSQKKATVENDSDSLPVS